MRDLSAVIDEKTGMVEVSWHPENSSTQDSYKLQYHEVETTIGGDSNMLTTDKTKVWERLFYFNKCKSIEIRGLVTRRIERRIIITFLFKFLFKFL